MKDDNAIAWRRVTLEGAVIVISILLAFAIDAWWDERNAREAELEQLVRVAQELEANTKRLQRKLNVILTSIEGTEELISWMGPEPINVPPDVFHGHWPKFFSIGMYSVPRGAVQDYLATGTARSSRHAVMRFRSGILPLIISKSSTVYCESLMRESMTMRMIKFRVFMTSSGQVS